MVGDLSKAKNLKYDRLVGVEFEAIVNDSQPISLPRECGVSNDASIPSSRGREVQTPPASADTLEWLILKVCSELNKGQAIVDQSCGLHIHLDGKDFVDNQKNTIRLTNSYFVLEPIIWAMLPYTRRTNKYTAPLIARISDKDYRQLLRVADRKDMYYLHKKWYKTEDTRHIQSYKGMAKSGPRRHGFNLSALLAVNHLELRYHPGTINADKVRNWVWLHLHIMDWVLKGYSKRKIENIRKAKSLDQKVALFFQYLSVPEKLQQYVSFRVAKCSNPSYREEYDDGAYNDGILEDTKSVIRAIEKGNDSHITKY